MKWVLALLLLPLAAAQAPVISDAELVEVHTLPWDKATAIVDPRGKAGGSYATGTCDIHPARAEPEELFGAPTQPAPWFVLFPEFDSFRFAETDDENACAELRFPFKVPKGAQDVEVTFDALRNIRGTNPSWPFGTTVVSDLVFYDDPPPPQGAANTDYERQPLRFRENAMDMEPFVHGHRLLPDQDNVTIAWYIEETGDSDFTQPANLAGGHEVELQAEYVRVRFTGSPLRELDVSHKETTPTAGGVQYESRVSFVVPESEQQHEVRFSLDRALRLQSVQGPNGPVLLREFTSSDDGQRVAYTLGSDVLARHGAGAYTFAFTSVGPVEVTPVAVPVFGFVALAPLIAGVLAQRNASHYVALHGVRQRRIQYGILAQWAVYAGAVVLTFWTGNHLLAMRWPIQGYGQIPYYVFILLTASFVFTLQLVRRRELGAVRRDLDDREKMARELQRSNQDLAQFASAASHDLKEPLRMVSGYTQLLKRRFAADLPEEAQMFIDHAADGAVRMGEMVDALLAYSRVRMDKEPEEVDMTALAAMAKSQVRMTMEEVGAEIVIKDLGTVRGDRMLLLHLLQNLLQNALKFRSPTRKPKIRVTATREPGVVTIAVQDNGIGMAKQDHERIFDMFQRIHARDVYQGSGIGLALCQKIAQEHDGKLWVESELGEGATFFLQLPSG